MNVLVIGGTSFFGKAIVEQLIAEGHKVSVLSRGNQKPDLLSQVNHITCDRTDKADLAAKVGEQNFDCVIDNIAYNRTDAENAVEVFKGKIGRYIFTSTAALYYTGNMEMPAIEPNTNFSFQPPEGEEELPLWTYTMGKTHAENFLVNQSELEYTIIRPPVVLGPDDVTLRGYFYFQRLMDGKPTIITNGGVQSFKIVYSEDLAKGYLLAMNSPKAVNQTYNIAQKEVVTLKMLLEESGKALNITPELVNISHASLEASGFEYPETYARMQNFILDITKAEQELGYITTPFSDWITKTALWYRDSYDGKDSAGYEDRDKEVAFAQKYKAAIAALAE